MEETKAITITKWLRDNHREFRDSLREIWTALQESPPEGITLAENELGKLIISLKLHEAIEEGILFPIAEEHSGLKGADTLELFKEDHHKLQQALDQLHDALGKESPPVSQIWAAMEFETLLREHMEQEEEVLFPLFEKNIPLEIQKELTEKAEFVAHRSPKNNGHQKQTNFF